MKSHHQWPEHWQPRSLGNSNNHPNISPLITLEKKPNEQWEPADPDQLLDALTYLKAGNWGSLQRLALQVNQDAYYPLELARSLSSLGHIELETDDEGRLIGWALAPKCLVIGASGIESFMTGSRSTKDLEWLDQVAIEVGATVYTSKTGTNLPSRVGLTGLNIDVILRLTELANDPVLQNLPGTILRESKPLHEVLHHLPIHDVGTGVSVRKFNVKTLTWEEDVYRQGETGAYQFGNWRRWYAYDDGSDLRRAEFQVVKHLAARSEGRPLISYENQISELRVPLGCELPGIYDRAATLCSGISATQHQDRPNIKVYRDVPESVAATIFNNIYG